MKYTVNWVEKNLGVPRKALRIYEEKGLMDKSTIQNPENKYREYSDKDIERIWCYRMLQDMQERSYGKDGCKFIAEALAHFGGYTSLKSGILIPLFNVT